MIVPINIPCDSLTPHWFLRFRLPVKSGKNKKPLYQNILRRDFYTSFSTYFLSMAGSYHYLNLREVLCQSEMFIFDKTTIVFNRIWKRFRVKKIKEQLSRTLFFTGFEIPALFSAAKLQGKKGGIFKFRKNRVLESFSNIFFTVFSIDSSPFLCWCVFAKCFCDIWIW